VNDEDVAALAGGALSLSRPQAEASKPHDGFVKPGGRQHQKARRFHGHPIPQSADAKSKTPR
jgi:hypothetical protein